MSDGEAFTWIGGVGVDGARCGYEGEAFTCKGEWVLVGVDVSNGEESRGSGIVCV